MKATPKLATENGEPFEIPEGGSLGLLALGYVGLMLWRKKRKEISIQKTKSSTDEKA
ncbi:MAG: hypothetical protein ACI85O_001305 [Saprospiraceae bacterium]|jgi:hypothetical protein